MIGYLQVLFPKIWNAKWPDVAKFWKFGTASRDGLGSGLILTERMRLVQEIVEDRIGDSCRAIEMDLVNGSIKLKEMINFVGGKAVILDEDMPILHQLGTVIDTIGNTYTASTVANVLLCCR